MLNISPLPVLPQSSVTSTYTVRALTFHLYRLPELQKTTLRLTKERRRAIWIVTRQRTVSTTRNGATRFAEELIYKVGAGQQTAGLVVKSRLVNIFCLFYFFKPKTNIYNRILVLRQKGRETGI